MWAAIAMLIESKMNEDSAYLKIKDLAEQDRPREKLLSLGAKALTNSELLGIIIGSGSVNMSAVDVAKNILKRYNDNLHSLGSATFADLCKFKGIGEARAINILAALELGRRRETTRPIDKPIISSSTDAFVQLHPRLADNDHEEIIIIYLNRRNAMLSIETLSTGGLNGTVCDVRMVIKRALELSASGIIMSHNHPSGTLLPSAEDDRLTHHMFEACKTMDITLQDHIIIVPSSITEHIYYSYADNGRIR